MDIWGIIKSVGGAVVRNAVPGGGLIVDAVNALLPDDAKLPTDATGHDIKRAVEALPPEQRAAIEQKRFDVEIAQIRQENSTVRAMLEADTKTPHTTRPLHRQGVVSGGRVGNGHCDCAVELRHRHRRRGHGLHRDGRLAIYPRRDRTIGNPALGVFRRAQTRAPQPPHRSRGSSARRRPRQHRLRPTQALTAPPPSALISWRHSNINRSAAAGKSSARSRSK